MEFKIELGNKKIEVQLNELAEQASGSSWLRMGETTIFSVCQMGEENPEIDYFPLICQYQEKHYAKGEILGSRFLRREGKPSDQSALISRLIDRSVRPLFPKELKREIQIIPNCLSWDEEGDPGVLGLIGTSLALSISEIPWLGPVGAVRIGRKEGEFILFPTQKERKEGELDILLAGIEEKGKFLTNMIECQSREVSEKVILEALEFAEPYLKKIIEFQKEIIKKKGKEKALIEKPEEDSNWEKEVRNLLEKKLEKAFYLDDKKEKEKKIKELQQEIEKKLKDKEKKDKYLQQAEKIIEEEKEAIIKKAILKDKRRIDGRKMNQLRDISAELDFLPRVHGSALFQRGETKVLSVLTLSGPDDRKLIEEMEISGKRRFMHHYNFPPYSAGDVRPLRAPNRREIGHGSLARNALIPLLPSFESFPYTIRVVSEILSSNGSTSMASVSGACLALMAGGVPIKKHLAGIAMGLIAEEDLSQYQILTDIRGAEDHYGKMDFKVAGTEDGITAIQMDTKIKGINEEIFKEALSGAQEARKKIIAVQKKTIKGSREKLSPYAPKINILEIDPDKIGGVIGPGGKIINEIIDDCQVSIDIEDSGKVFITGQKDELIEKAVEWIKNITKEIKTGEIFQGKVKKILDFGAVVEIFPGQEGLVHISEFADFHIKSLDNIIKVGQIIPVKVISVDDQGKIKLSAQKAGFKIKKQGQNGGKDNS